jgi:hypothetical protein
VLYRHSTNKNFDIALVTTEPTYFAAIQAERKKSALSLRVFLNQSSRWGEGAWLSLEPSFKVHAKRLANFALHNELVLFVGAGVSMAAGLPSWVFCPLSCEVLSPFLGCVAEAASGQRQAHGCRNCLSKRPQFAGPSSYCGATSGRTREAGRGGGAEAAGVLTALPLTLMGLCSRQAPLYSVSHALLAGLPVKEIITTNYDKVPQVFYVSSLSPF